MTEERRHIILDAEHGHRRSRAFAMLIVAGLILILAVWFLQLKNAFYSSKLSEVAHDLVGFGASVTDSLATAPSPQPAWSAVNEAIKPTAGTTNPATSTQPVTP